MMLASELEDILIVLSVVPVYDTRVGRRQTRRPASAPVQDWRCNLMTAACECLAPGSAF
jgi:hypothetical protein